PGIDDGREREETDQCTADGGQRLQRDHPLPLAVAAGEDGADEGGEDVAADVEAGGGHCDQDDGGGKTGAQVSPRALRGQRRNRTRRLRLAQLARASTPPNRRSRAE